MESYIKYYDKGDTIDIPVNDPLTDKAKDTNFDLPELDTRQNTDGKKFINRNDLYVNPAMFYFETENLDDASIEHNMIAVHLETSNTDEKENSNDGPVNKEETPELCIIKTAHPWTYLVLPDNIDDDDRDVITRKPPPHIPLPFKRPIVRPYEMNPLLNPEFLHDIIYDGFSVDFKYLRLKLMDNKSIDVNITKCCMLNLNLVNLNLVDVTIEVPSNQVTILNKLVAVIIVSQAMQQTNNHLHSQAARYFANAALVNTNNVNQASTSGQNDTRPPNYQANCLNTPRWPLKGNAKTPSILNTNLPGRVGTNPNFTRPPQNPNLVSFNQNNPNLTQMNAKMSPNASRISTNFNSSLVGCVNYNVTGPPSMNHNMPSHPNSYSNANSIGPRSTMNQNMPYRPNYQNMPKGPHYRNIPNHTHYQNRPNHPKAPNMTNHQNTHNVPNRPHYQNIPNHPNFQNMLNHSNLQNTPNQPVHQNIPNHPNLQNTLNQPVHQNMPNHPNFQNIPNKSIHQNIPNHLKFQNMPNQPLLQNIPNKSIHQNMPNHLDFQNMPNQPILQNMPNHSNFQNTPNKPIYQNMPNHSNFQNIPIKPNHQNMPNHLNFQNMPNQPIFQNIPNHSNLQNAPNQPIYQNMPNHPNFQNIPNKPIHLNMPNHLNFQNMPNQPIHQNMPYHFNFQDMPNQPIHQNMPNHPNFQNMPNQPIHQNMPNQPIHQNMQNQPIHQNMQNQPIHQNMQNQPIHQNMQNQPIHQNMPNQPIHQNMQNQPIHQNMQNQPIHQNMQNQPIHQNMQNQPIHQNMQNQPIHQKMPNPIGAQFMNLNPMCSPPIIRNMYNYPHNFHSSNVTIPMNHAINAYARSPFHNSIRAPVNNQPLMNRNIRYTLPDIRMPFNNFPHPPVNNCAPNMTPYPMRPAINRPTANVNNSSVYFPPNNIVISAEVAPTYITKPFLVHHDVLNFLAMNPTIIDPRSDNCDKINPSSVNPSLNPELYSPPITESSEMTSMSIDLLSPIITDSSTTSPTTTDSNEFSPVVSDAGVSPFKESVSLDTNEAISLKDESPKEPAKGLSTGPKKDSSVKDVNPVNGADLVIKEASPAVKKSNASKETNSEDKDSTDINPPIIKSDQKIPKGREPKRSPFINVLFDENYFKGKRRKFGAKYNDKVIKIVQSFLTFASNDDYTHFTFLGPFEPKESEAICIFMALYSRNTGEYGDMYKDLEHLLYCHRRDAKESYVIKDNVRFNYVIEKKKI